MKKHLIRVIVIAQFVFSHAIFASEETPTSKKNYKVDSIRAGFLEILQSAQIQELEKAIQSLDKNRLITAVNFLKKRDCWGCYTYRVTFDALESKEDRKIDPFRYNVETSVQKFATGPSSTGARVVVDKVEFQKNSLESTLTESQASDSVIVSGRGTSSTCKAACEDAEETAIRELKSLCPLKYKIQSKHVAECQSPGDYDISCYVTIVSQCTRQ